MTGGFVLAADPTRGLALPVERNPRRPVYDADRVDALKAVAHRVTMRLDGARKPDGYRARCPILLRLAADTGRRISAILALRASNWRPDQGTHGRILWRADSDKVGRDWLAPVIPEVREELERHRREHGLVGEALLFPAPNSTTGPVSVQVASDWLSRAAKLAELEPLPRGAWHSFRRRWATERKHLGPQGYRSRGRVE